MDESPQPRVDPDVGAALWAVLDLLDRQVVDRNGSAVGKVDDLELHLPGDGSPPVVLRVLSGAEALGLRIGGLVGRAMAGTARRAREQDEGVRGIAMGLVAQLGPAVRLSATAAEAGLEPGLEVWVRRNVVERLPGGGHAPR